MITMDLEQDVSGLARVFSHFEHLLRYIHLHGEPKLKRKKADSEQLQRPCFPEQDKRTAYKKRKERKISAN